MDNTPWPDADAPPAVSYGFDAARVVGTVARNLRGLADRLDQESQALLRGDGKAGYHAGQIISEFTQQTGGLGTYLFSVVDSAAKADVHAAVEPMRKLAQEWSNHSELGEAHYEQEIGRLQGTEDTYNRLGDILNDEIRQVLR